MSGKKNKKADVANHQTVAAMQWPIFVEGEYGDIAGFVTLNPAKVPKGAFGLQPGTDDSGDTVLAFRIAKAKKGDDNVTVEKTPVSPNAKKN